MWSFLHVLLLFLQISLVQVASHELWFCSSQPACFT